MTASERAAHLPFLAGFHDASADLVDYVYRRTDALLDAADEAIRGLRTVADVRSRQARARQRTEKAIGGLIEERTALAAELRGTVHREGYTIEKLIFQSSPGMYVTANLYRPVAVDSPRPAVLFLCGHSEPGKAEPGYQRVCAWLAMCGFIVLIIDPIGQGERMSYLDADGTQIVPWGIDEHSYVGLQCWWLGSSLARYFVHDARRALDFLTAQDDVDSSRLGITGSSGGGTQSALMMMLDDRIAAAAPATFITSRRAYLRAGQAQDAEQILLGGTRSGITHADFLMAMAPRPVRVLAVDYDFFPIEGTVASVNQAQRAFELFGRSENLSLVRTRALHGYTTTLARSAVDFFIRHLGDNAHRELPEFEPVAQQDLMCTTTGQVQLEYEDSRTVFDLVTGTSHLRARAGTESVPERSRRWLHERVVAGRSTSPEFFPRWLERRTVRPGVTERRVMWRSESDLFAHGVLYEPADEPAGGFVLAVLESGSEVDCDRQAWVDSCVADGQAVLMLDVRGVGALTPRPVNSYPVAAHYGTIFKLTCDLLEIDDSLAAGRVYDVLRALEFLRTDQDIALGVRPLSIHASGTGQFYAVLAAALDDDGVAVAIEEDLIDPRTHVSSRYYDFEQSLALLIPGLLEMDRFGDLLSVVGDRVSGPIRAE